LTPGSGKFIIRNMGIVRNAFPFLFIVTISCNSADHANGAEEEVDYNQYCDDYCAVKAHREVVECDIYNGMFMETEVLEMCREALSCDDMPELCTSLSYSNPFISEREAEECLEALGAIPCESWGTTPIECESDNLCDPE
jgi:hypothetical protein